MNPNQTPNGPRLGNISLTEDQFKQLSTLKTYADMGIPDSYLMPYFEQVMGQSFVSPSDKSQQEMEDEAAKLQLYQLRKELGLDTSGLEKALGIGSTPGVLDIKELGSIDALKKEIANQELQGNTVDPKYKRLVEFADYNPDMASQLGEANNIISNETFKPTLGSLGETIKFGLGSTIPLYTPFYLYEKMLKGNEAIKKKKFGSDYDMLSQYMSSFE